jgi:23S rRNA (uracil1939-C5)-methyltransferase
VQKGELRTVTAEALGTTDAVARVDGYVVLVPGLLPGERALVRITSATRKFGRGELVSVLAPSPDRVDPRCRHFLECGGCHLQHLAYPAQALHKQQRLQRTLQHALGDDAPEVRPMLVPADPYGQRHKVALHLTGDGPTLAGGFRMARSPDLVVLEECPASDPQAFALARATITQLRSLGLPATDRPGGVLCSVVVRRAAGTGEACVLIVVTHPVRGLKALCPVLRDLGATTVAANVHDGDTAQLLGHDTIVLAGPERIRERIGRVTYCLSPASFFQTAPWGAERLVGLVHQALAPKPRENVLDLYCGGGLFALALAPSCASVLGIEENPVSAGDAVEAAELLGLENVRILTGRVEDRLRTLARTGAARPDKIVLDPPRTGCGPELAAAIARLGAAAIAYVSCDPDALAADLQSFHQHGYRTAAVTPVDMFPQTHHVEAVAELRRS